MPSVRSNFKIDLNIWEPDIKKVGQAHFLFRNLNFIPEVLFAIFVGVLDLFVRPLPSPGSVPC